MITTLLLVTLLTIAAALALHRDIARAVAARRRRLALRRLNLAAVQAAGVTMGQAVTAAARFEEAMRQVSVTINLDTSRLVDGLRAAARKAGER